MTGSLEGKEVMVVFSFGVLLGFCSLLSISLFKSVISNTFVRLWKIGSKISKQIIANSRTAVFAHARPVKILYVNTDRICECSFKDDGSVTKIDNVQ